jgi:small subunit ribosomal protein S20
VATHKSAAKRARQTIKRAARNRNITSHIKTAARSVREAVIAGKKDDAVQALNQTTRLVFKAASKGVLHKRTAARRVSRLTLAVNAV